MRRIHRVLAGTILAMTLMMLGGNAWANHRVTLTDTPSGMSGSCELVFKQCVVYPEWKRGEWCGGEPRVQTVYDFWIGDNEGVPPVVLAGDIDLKLKTADQSYATVWSGKIKIAPGFGAYTAEAKFALDYTFTEKYLRPPEYAELNNQSRNPKVFNATCNFSGSVVGIAVGDPFEIGGPCIAVVNEEEDYPMYLLNTLPGGEVVAETRPLPLLDEIVSNGSHVKVTKDGNPAPFVLASAEITDGDMGWPDDDPPEWNPISVYFPNVGLHEIEVIWMMREGVVGNEKEVSRDTKKVFVTSSPVFTVISTSHNPAVSGGTAEMKFEMTGATIGEVSEAPTGGQVYLVVMGEFEAGSGGHEADKHDPTGTSAEDWIIEPCESRQCVWFGTAAGASSSIPSIKVPLPEFGGKVRYRLLARTDRPWKGESAPTDQRLRRLKLEADGNPHGVFQLGKVEIEVKVPNLELLPDAIDPDDYEKIGGTTKHLGPPSSTPDNNHWGTHDTNEALKKIAARYDLLTFSTDPLKINDMSLPSGGLFDKNGNWKTPHSKHRIGKNADIRGKSSAHPDGVPFSGYDEFIFKKVVRYYNGDFLPESVGTSNAHYHLTF